MPNPNRASNSRAQHTSVTLQGYSDMKEVAPPPDSEINACFNAVDSVLSRLEALSFDLNGRLYPVQLPAGPSAKDDNKGTVGPASQFGQALDVFRARIDAVNESLADQLRRLAI